MIKNNIYTYMVFSSILFSSSYLEIDIGHHAPQGDFDKYSEPGFSFRGSYSWPDSKKSHIKYDFSIQYLHFDSQTWIDNSSYPITVTNSEQSVGFLLGPRLMSPTTRGALRPYLGLKGGFFVFSETIKYEWEDDLSEFDLICLFLNLADSDGNTDCYQDNSGSVSNTLDSEFYLGAIFEMGSNLKINDSVGLDFGIQYNIIPALEAIDSNYFVEEDVVNGESPDLTVTQIAKTINADYITFYIGCYFKL
jgi:hypothetical protein